MRELENCIERAIALGSGDEILVRDLPPAVAGHQLFVHEIEDPPPRMPQPPLSSENDLEALERATIQRVFDQVKGDKAAALKMLGISRATLYRKLKRYSIGEKELSSERA
ncbi:MAG: helix-turn-helix domain-containing protein [Candidatus Angelobacter sp.]